MPDLPSLLPHDTVIVTVPVDAESLPGFIVIQLVPKPKGHNFAPRTNQAVLNIFRATFGADYWQVVTRAGLSALAGNRAAVYSGPDVEGLPLSQDEKSRLVAAMG